MSSRIFEATSSFGTCALSARPIERGAPCFYLTCLGSEARPGQEVERSSAADGYATGYRTVPAGWTTVGRGRNERRKRVYAWEQRAEDGTWRRVAVWENLVLEAAARELGYRVPGGTTRAERGRRTVGYAHQLEATAVDVGGTVATETPPEDDGPSPADAVDVELRALEARRLELLSRRRGEDARAVAIEAAASLASAGQASARPIEVAPAIPPQAARRNPYGIGSFMDNDDARAERTAASAARGAAQETREEREAAARAVADARPRGITGYREGGRRLLDLD